MRSARSIVLFLTVIVICLAMSEIPAALAGQGSTEPSSTTVDKLLKEARKDDEVRSSMRIEIEGMLAADLSRVDLYGRGIGIWNGKRQFTTDSKTVVSAIDLLLEAEFSKMPERFAYETEKDKRPFPMKAVRRVTVAIDDVKKTVMQDDRGPLSEPFAALTEDLVALCRKSAEEDGVTAASLEEGLRKIADGRLAPEAMTISVNAPQLKSLKSQAGQGWLLNVQHGRLSLSSNTLEEGIRKVFERPFAEKECRALAKELLGAGAPGLQPRINTSGYTQISVAVLDHKVRAMAREFAAPPDEKEKAAIKTFTAVREVLHELYDEGLESTAKK